jgi:hypothetical protein
MDRLLHGAHVLTIDGESYRNPPSDRPRKPQRLAAPEGGVPMRLHIRAADPIRRPAAPTRIAADAPSCTAAITGSVWPTRTRSVPPALDIFPDESPRGCMKRILAIGGVALVATILALLLLWPK